MSKSLKELFEWFDAEPQQEFDWGDQPRWIPVHEKLPDEEGEYIVTMAYKEAYVGIVDYGYPDEHYKEKCFYVWEDDGFDLFTPIVSAWMPLPKPYKEVQKDD